MPDRVMARASGLTSDPASAMHPRHAVMPTVFIAGPPKSASTFLWACVHSIFRPESVCGGGSVEQWRDHDCGGRGFVLPFLEYAAWRGPGFHPEKESKSWCRDFSWGMWMSYNWCAAMYAALSSDIPFSFSPTLCCFPDGCCRAD